MHITAPIGVEEAHPLRHKMMATAYRIVMRMPVEAVDLDQAVVEKVVRQPGSPA